jgi:hypothetical protein
MINCLPATSFYVTSKKMRLEIIISIIALILILFCILRIIFAKAEGFSNDAQYEALRVRLKTSMDSYCQLASFAQEQIKQAYTTSKPGNAGDGSLEPGESESQANAHLQETYNEVYACTDPLAVSRPACRDNADAMKKYQEEDIDINKIKPPPVRPFVPCDTYLNLPNSSDPSKAAYMLSTIPDDLADRIIRELDWYNAIADALAKGIEKGRNHDTVPDSPKVPLKSWGPEGFADAAQCSPSAQQARMERERRERMLANPADNPDTCLMPNLDAQVKRVNSLLNSQALRQALAMCDIILAKMKKVKSDLDKAQKGELYDWQKDGPKKVVAPFAGGDRAAALIYSMKINQM